LYLATAFKPGGLLKFGLDYDIKVLFGITQVAGIVDTVLVSSLGKSVWLMLLAMKKAL
jgi:hypothetical protein